MFYLTRNISKDIGTKKAPEAIGRDSLCFLTISLLHCNTQITSVSARISKKRRRRGNNFN
jgi:hypothetical protein